MSEDEQRNPEIYKSGGPDRPVNAAGPVGSPGEDEAAQKLRRKQKSDTYAWLLAVAMTGWNFATTFFGKTALPKQPDGRAGTAIPAQGAMARLESAPQESGRGADLSLDGSETEIRRREKWGTFLVLCAFLVGVAAGFGFLFAYWSDGSNLLLGGTAALCLGAFGAALVLSSHWLMRNKEATEPREVLPSGPEAREAALKSYCSGAHDVQRRSMLKWMAAGGMGLLGAMIVSLARSLGFNPANTLYSTVWKHGQRLVTSGGEPMTVGSLQPGSSITVFPENSQDAERSQTVLIRVKEQLLQLPQARANWAPMGYIAYSRVCTHAGCPVGLFEAEQNLLLCPCHQSTFDVLRGALPTGGPAARPLPQLPLYVDSEGNLRAAGGFTEPPGPGFWGMP